MFIFIYLYIYFNFNFNFNFYLILIYLNQILVINLQVGNWSLNFAIMAKFDSSASLDPSAAQQLYKKGPLLIFIPHHIHLL